MTLQRASLVSSIFPERDNSCYFLVQENGDDGTLCKTPLDYKEDKELAGLMTLKNFIEGGYDIADGKILVCVKSIGAKKTCRSNKVGHESRVDTQITEDAVGVKKQC